MFLAGLVEATERAISARDSTPSPYKVHDVMKGVYTWHDIANRTSKVTTPTLLHCVVTMVTDL